MPRDRMNDDDSKAAFLSRLFLFDRTNERFIDGSTRQTAKQSRLATSAAIAICVSIVFGWPVTSLYKEDAALSRRFKEHGRNAEGIVLKKRSTSSGQGRDFCYVAYRFQAARQNAPAMIFDKESMVSDFVFDHISEGQAVGVIYDPDAPETSMLAVSVHSPRFPLWLVWGWWMASVIVISWFVMGYVSERRFSLRGLRNLERILSRFATVLIHRQGKRLRP
jgi:hypothetical protein